MLSNLNSVILEGEIITSPEDDGTNLSVMLKIVHKTEGSEKYELHAKAHIKGKAIVSEVVERNLFVALDEVLQHIVTLDLKEEELSKE